LFDHHPTVAPVPAGRRRSQASEARAWHGVQAKRHHSLAFPG
jgi:hypothetical protein